MIVDQHRIDEVAKAILGGEPMSDEEMEEARECAVDVLRVFAKLDVEAGRAPIDTFEEEVVQS